MLSLSATVVVWGPSDYKNDFSIRAEIDTPGRYWIDGFVDLNLDGGKTSKVLCIDKLFSEDGSDAVTVAGALPGRYPKKKSRHARHEAGVRGGAWRPRHMRGRPG